MEQQAQITATGMDHGIIKVSQFWPQDPSLWFLKLKGQFQIHNITAYNTKYSYVLRNLDLGYKLKIFKQILQKTVSTKN